MLRTSTLCLLVSLLFPQVSRAAPATPGFEQATRIQQVRNDVEALAGKDAQPAALRRGIGMLEAELASMDQPQARELGVGNDFLYARGHDVRYDLAQLYARLGEKEKALDSLEAMPGFTRTHPRVFGGKGIVPDVEVRETVEGVRADRDVVLERALALLKEA